MATFIGQFRSRDVGQFPVRTQRVLLNPSNRRVEQFGAGITSNLICSDKDACVPIFLKHQRIADVFKWCLIILRRRYRLLNRPSNLINVDVFGGSLVRFFALPILGPLG
jgi:hypothetical protein